MRVGIVPDVYSEPAGGPSRAIKVRLLRKRQAVITQTIIQGPSASQNHKHKITFSEACRGHIRLGMGVELSEALRQNHDGPTWQATLVKMLHIGTGNLTVTKNGLEYTLEWVGSFANKFVQPLRIVNETALESYLSGYWLTKDVIYAHWPVGSTWLSEGQVAPGHKTYSMMPLGKGPITGTYPIYVKSGISPTTTLSTINVPYNSTAAQVQSLLNADPNIKANGCKVIGLPLTGGQMQIDMFWAVGLVRLSSGTSDVHEVVPCGRSVQVVETLDGWNLVGVSWNY